MYKVALWQKLLGSQLLWACEIQGAPHRFLMNKTDISQSFNSEFARHCLEGLISTVQSTLLTTFNFSVSGNTFKVAFQVLISCVIAQITYKDLSTVFISHDFRLLEDNRWDAYTSSFQTPLNSQSTNRFYNILVLKAAIVLVSASQRSVDKDVMYGEL